MTHYERWARRQRRRQARHRLRRRLTPRRIRQWEHRRMLERCELVDLRLRVVYLNSLVVFARRERDELRAER